MTRDQKDSLSALLSDGRVMFDEPTSDHSVAGCGGAPEAFVRVENLEELKSLLGWAIDQQVDYRFWGRGSSTLVRDAGLPGLLVELGDAFKEIRVDRTDGDDVYLSVGASALTADLLDEMRSKGFVGDFDLDGFAGTVAGALCSRKEGGEDYRAEAFEEVTIVNKEGQELTLRRPALRFESGRLKVPRTAAVTRVLVKVRAGGPTASADEATPGTEHPSFGRVFASPCKPKASVMIDEEGLTGVRVGGARVDERGGIVNEGGAKARDVAVLVSLVRDRVKQGTGVLLDTVVDIIGRS